MPRPLIRVTRKTTVIDRGWNKISRELRGSSNSHSKIGLPANGKTSGRYSMPDLIDVAFENEFGNKKIPERSFIRSAVDENAPAIKAIQAKAVRAVTGGQTTIRQALIGMGEAVEKMIKQKIKTGPFAPNAPLTVKKKGSSQPLIDTGQLINSIQHEEVILP
jgi:hypothetical protein